MHGQQNIKIIIPSQLYMFRAMFSPIIRSTWLYLQHLVILSNVAAGRCYGCVGTLFQRKHRPKHVELTRNNKLTRIIASRWCFSQLYHDPRIHERHDRCLFGPPLKKHFVGNEFAVTDDGVKQAVTSWPQTLDTDSLSVGIQALVLWRHVIKCQ